MKQSTGSDPVRCGTNPVKRDLTHICWNRSKKSFVEKDLIHEH